MKFNSVKEYFYKLNSAGYQRLMLPLIVFILYFGQSAFALFQPFLTNEIFVEMFFYGCLVIALVILTTVQLLAYQKIKAIRKKIGLGIKLEEYANAVLKRMNGMSFVSTVLPMALFVSADNRLAIIFAVIFLIFFVQWPSPKRVARQLRLKGDERMMVVSRGDAFKF